MNWLLMAAALGCGAVLTTQVATNKQLGESLHNLYLPAVANMVVGLVAAVAITLVASRDWPTSDMIKAAPWYGWLGGGVLGAIYLTGNILLAPRLGAASLIGLVVNRPDRLLGDDGCLRMVRIRTARRELATPRRMRAADRRGRAGLQILEGRISSRTGGMRLIAGEMSVDVSSCHAECQRRDDGQNDEHECPDRQLLLVRVGHVVASAALTSLYPARRHATRTLRSPRHPPTNRPRR